MCLANDFEGVGIDDMGFFGAMIVDAGVARFGNFAPCIETNSHMLRHSFMQAPGSGTHIGGPTVLTFIFINDIRTKSEWKFFLHREQGANGSSVGKNDMNIDLWIVCSEHRL